MNINLWFARGKSDDEIIQIFDAKIEDNYTCPICNSEVIPKALESQVVTPHFAHIDRSKCTGEQMIHWWYKHKFIEQGDSFTIKTDKETKYICKDISIEVEYNLTNGIYRPDLVVFTECGEEIIFEMANKNKKNTEEYISRWIEMKKIVVEVEIRNLIDNDRLFTTLYHKNKLTTTSRRFTSYYKTIGRIKERMRNEDKYDIEKIKQLDWFWKELAKYKLEGDEANLFNIMDNLDSEDIEFIGTTLDKTKCKNIYPNYLRDKTIRYRSEIKRSLDIDDTIFDKTISSGFGFYVGKLKGYILMYDKHIDRDLYYNVLKYDLKSLITIAEEQLYINNK